MKTDDIKTWCEHTEHLSKQADHYTNFHKEETDDLSTETNVYINLTKCRDVIVSYHLIIKM